MLLVLDVGNSRLKIGVFDGDNLHSKLAFPISVIGAGTDASAAVGTILELPIEAAIACSVVPSLDSSVSSFVKDYFRVDPYFVRNDDDFGLDVRYQPLEAAGTDRLVNCFAAAELYSVPCIVCSLGTATTIDAVDRDRVLLGGLIAPGMRTSAKALELAAERLPEVEVNSPSSLLATTTVTSMQSGIYYSQVGLIETVVDRLCSQLEGSASVIATGGFAPLIAPDISVVDVWDQNLTLTGLRLLHGRLSHHPV